MDNSERFGVPPAYWLVTGGSALLLAVVAAQSSGRDSIMASLGAFLLAEAAVITFRIRKRLEITADYLVIGRLTGSRQIPRSDVISVTVARTARSKAASIELELPDHQRLVFSRFELGADPATVAAALRRHHYGQPHNESRGI